MNRRIRLVAVDVQRAATLQVQHREGMDMLVVAAAYDRALAVLWHDEGERGGVDLARMNRDAVFRAHVPEHPSEPVIGHGGDQVRYDAQFGATERRGNRVAAERDGVGRGDMLFVAGWHVI